MRSFYRSTVGKKIVMALTGLVLVGFVIGHMIGNLLAFRGEAALNAYSGFLKSSAGVLWSVRLLLLVSVVLHITAAVQLTRIDRKARPIGYDQRDPQVSTIASRTIRWGGVVILIFVVFHLLHLTTGNVHPSFDHTNVYGNVVSGFRVWWVSAFYIAAMVALGLHLYHGTWSSVRTLGASRSGADPLSRKLPALLALLVGLGFAAVPAGVLAGLIH
ncbi:MAG: succinate dehydrogenase cytochrome b subunit [Gemmatimonadaceae bacterium]